MIYSLDIKNDEDFARALRQVQADPRAFNYLNPKKITRLLFAAKLDYRAAAFIKQELLARGGDAAVAKHVIDGKSEKSDILIIANDSQIFRLLEKLKAMDCWGLKNFRAELFDLFKNIKNNKNKWNIKLPDGRELELNQNTKIMGIINLTPDSFYPESRVTLNNLVKRAEKMIDDGADIIDIGAESTRPNSAPLDYQDELNRLIPALKELKINFKDIIISVDTYKGAVAEKALNAGADIINDIGGFNFDDNMLKVIKETGAPYILSHIEGTPQSMKNFEGHGDITGDLILYFQEKLKILTDSANKDNGVDLEKIIIDPGLGFAKDFNDNLALIKNIEAFNIFNRPLLIGHSRKRFLHGDIFETVAVSALIEGKAQIIRVHDVSENKKALIAARAVRESELWR